MNLRPMTSIIKKAYRYIPGGVNSPARAFRAVEAEPIFIERGSGCYLFDIGEKDI